MTPKARGQLRWDVFDEWEDAEPHRTAWDRLVETTGGPVFNSFDWCRTWWEFYGRRRQLLIILTWNGDDLVGIWSLFRETLLHGGLPLRLIRVVGCDFGVASGAVTYAAGYEEAVTRALHSVIMDTCGDKWDAVCIGPSSLLAIDMRALVAAAENIFADADVAFDDNARPYVVFDLPKTWKEFLEKLSKSRRHEILRQHKLLSKEHRVEHIVRTSKDEIAEILPEFFRSHEYMWRERGLRGYFNEWPQAKAFHQKLIERLTPDGRAFVSELTVDGCAVAWQYCFRMGRVAHGFQPTRVDSPEWRKRSVGNIAFLLLAEHALSTGVSLIDVGGAPIEHKLSLGGRLEKAALFSIVRHGASTALRLHAFRAGAWLLHNFYARLWYSTIAPATGLDKSAYLPSWVRSRVPLVSTRRCAGGRDCDERKGDR